MSHKRYFSYVRVSTVRQGQTGTSLAEQLAAIERYARKWDLDITNQYEEQETAAKAGRPVFLEMLKALRQGKAAGVVIHKIDRSARNLKDWADLGSLIDSGIEVHFANEAIDLHSRGGRLSADIQAVVAADYIRNLREEVRKGFYGRLKQGLYPMPAPLGYTDSGQGKPKEPHPLYAPLVKKAFEFYSTGKWSVYALTKTMKEQGLRNKNGNPVSKNGIHTMLKNKFYTGLIEINKTGEIFVGQHEPVITQSLFDRVQAILSGKKIDKKQRHFFVFRKLISCRNCSYSLVAERQKGFVYYRCHTVNCNQKTIREEAIEEAYVPFLRRLQFNEAENRHLEAILAQEEKENESLMEIKRQSLNLRLEQCRARLSKLTDAFIDGNLEQELFVDKKNSLILEEQRLKEELRNVTDKKTDAFSKIRKVLERANRAYSSYIDAIEIEKREMMQILTSNLEAEGKSVLIKLNYPFELIVNRADGLNGGAYRDVPRTNSLELSRLVKSLYEFFSVSETDQRK